MHSNHIRVAFTHISHSNTLWVKFPEYLDFNSEYIVTHHPFIGISVQFYINVYHYLQYPSLVNFIKTSLLSFTGFFALFLVLLPSLIPLFCIVLSTAPWMPPMVCTPPLVLKGRFVRPTELWSPRVYSGVIPGNSWLIQRLPLSAR